jgi:hypothetical protein
MAERAAHLVDDVFPLVHRTADGQVILDLRRRWADGTTQLLFEPVELLERLAALTPRPRINLLTELRDVARPRTARSGMVRTRHEFSAHDPRRACGAIRAVPGGEGGAA